MVSCGPVTQSRPYISGVLSALRSLGRSSIDTNRAWDLEGSQLLVNCRSHGGIVKCANAIIQLFQRFPSAIDVLQPEAGVARSEISEMPKFFIANVFLPENAISSLCQPDGPAHLDPSNVCKFIIVRDEAVRQELRRDTGRVGIALYIDPFSHRIPRLL